MKKAFLIALTLFAFACKPSLTPQQKAETLVKNYLDSILNDPKSYEALIFGKLDTVYTSFKFSPESEVFNRKIDSLNEILINMDSKMAFYNIAQLKQSAIDDQRLSKQVQDVLDAKTEAALNYKGKFKGYSIVHEYRAKNSFNALIKTSNTFMIDSTLTKVWDVKN